MKPAKFEYLAPTRIDEVIDALARHGGDARLLAGGQSLVPTMNFRLAKPAFIIDLNQVSALAYVREEGDEIAVGAMTRQRTIETSALIRQHAPLLHQATRWIAHLPIRTRGTIGGSVSNADPAAEDPAVVLALDATLVVRSARGTRQVAAADFFTGLLSTALQADEVLTELRFKKAGEGVRAAFAEISRRHGDFALAGVGVQLTMRGGKIDAARMAACGVGPGPVRLSEAESIMVAGGFAAVDRAAQAAAAAASPSSDAHGSADYRRRLLREMTRRALDEALHGVA